MFSREVINKGTHLCHMRSLVRRTQALGIRVSPGLGALRATGNCDRAHGSHSYRACLTWSQSHLCSHRPALGASPEGTECGPGPDAVGQQGRGPHCVPDGLSRFRRWAQRQESAEGGEAELRRLRLVPHLRGRQENAHQVGVWQLCWAPPGGAVGSHPLAVTQQGSPGSVLGTSVPGRVLPGRVPCWVALVLAGGWWGLSWPVCQAAC